MLRVQHDRLDQEDRLGHAEVSGETQAALGRWCEWIAVGTWNWSLQREDRLQQTMSKLWHELFWSVSPNSRDASRGAVASTPDHASTVARSAIGIIGDPPELGGIMTGAGIFSGSSSGGGEDGPVPDQAIP